jgi:hypothetical protein
VGREDRAGLVAELDQLAANTGTPPISCWDRTTLPNGIAREFSACIDGCAMVA